jgi:hypothetical protein
MTIFATHVSLVLGAWRLRIRIDVDEPRDDAHQERGADETAAHAKRTALAVPSSN